jgi:hypothetical protein
MFMEHGAFARCQSCTPIRPAEIGSLTSPPAAVYPSPDAGDKRPGPSSVGVGSRRTQTHASPLCFRSRTHDPGKLMNHHNRRNTFAGAFCRVVRESTAAATNPVFRSAVTEGVPPGCRQTAPPANVLRATIGTVVLEAPVRALGAGAHALDGALDSAEFLYFDRQSYARPLDSAGATAVLMPDEEIQSYGNAAGQLNVLARFEQTST